LPVPSPILYILSWKKKEKRRKKKKEGKRKALVAS